MSKGEIADQEKEKEKEKEKIPFILEGSLKVIQGKTWHWIFTNSNLLCDREFVWWNESDLFC